MPVICIFFTPIYKNTHCKHTVGNVTTVYSKTHQPVNDSTSVFAIHKSTAELPMALPLSKSSGTTPPSHSSSHSATTLWQLDSYMGHFKICMKKFLRD